MENFKIKFQRRFNELKKVFIRIRKKRNKYEEFMKNYDDERSEKLMKLYSGAITDIMDSISSDYRN